MVGKPLYGFEPCDCDDGERYVFDDLAAAVWSAGLTYRAYPVTGESHGVTIHGFPRQKNTTIGEGPNPTTALLNAILKCPE